VRWIVTIYAVLLGYGTVVHLVDLAIGGTDPYPWAPPWLALYLVLLTVLDPLAATLLALRRRAGLHLACLVFVTDAAANGYAIYGMHGGHARERVGHAPGHADRGEQRRCRADDRALAARATRRGPGAPPLERAGPWTGLVAPHGHRRILPCRGIPRTIS